MRVILPSHKDAVQISELARQELDLLPAELDIAGDHVVITHWQPGRNNIRLFNWKKQEFARLQKVRKHS
jgi:hypothetical protein